MSILTPNEIQNVKQILGMMIQQGMIQPIVASGFSALIGNHQQYCMMFANNFLRPTAPNMNYTQQGIMSAIQNFCNQNMQPINQCIQLIQQQQQPQMNMGFQQPNNMMLPLGQQAATGVSMDGTPISNPAVMAVNVNTNTSVSPATGMQHRIESDDVPLEDVTEIRPLAVQSLEQVSDVLSREHCKLRTRPNGFTIPFSKEAQMLRFHLNGNHDASSALSTSYGVLTRAFGAYTLPFCHVISYDNFTSLDISKEDVRSIAEVMRSYGLTKTKAMYQLNCVPILRAWHDVMRALEQIGMGSFRKFENAVMAMAARKDNYDVRLFNDPDLRMFPTSFAMMSDVFRNSIKEDNPSSNMRCWAQVYFRSVLEVLVLFLNDGEGPNYNGGSQLIMRQNDDPVIPEKGETEQITSRNETVAENINMRTENHRALCEQNDLDMNSVHLMEREYVMLTNLPSAIKGSTSVRFAMPMDPQTMLRKMPHVSVALRAWADQLAPDSDMAQEPDQHRIIRLRRIGITDVDMRRGYHSYDICQSIGEGGVSSIFLDVASTS